MDSAQDWAASGFRHLIEPLSEERFFQLFWDQQTLVLNRRCRDFYADLLDLEAVDREIACDPIRLTSVDAAMGKSREVTHLDDCGAIFVEQALQGLAEGGTLVLDQLDRRIPALNRYCRALEKELSYRVHANVYVTAPGGRGFPPHYDTTNIFVLQIHGAKSWQVGRTRVAVPAAADPPDQALCVLSEAGKVFTLEAGDLAFLPRGFVHQAEAGPKGSIHVTLTVGAPCWSELAGEAEWGAGEMSALADLVPPGFLGEDPLCLARSLRARLSSPPPLETLVRAIEAFSVAWVRRHRPDLSRRLADLLGEESLDVGRWVVPRPGLLYRFQRDGRDLTLFCGRVTMQFEQRLGEAVRFCLETDRYRPQDLPAPLTRAEKIEVVSSLIRAGLVLRARAVSFPSAAHLC